MTPSFTWLELAILATIAYGAGAYACHQWTNYRKRDAMPKRDGGLIDP